MKILQFEPLLWTDIIDYPDLGVAMLMGVYNNNSLQSKLICTQLQYIEEMFLNYADELEYLFKSKSIEEQNNFQHLKSIKNSFSESFNTIYCRYYSKLWTNYLNATLTIQFKQLFTEITKLQFDYIKQGYCSVPIIDFFKKIITANQCDIIGVSLYEYSEYNRLLLGYLRQLTSTKIILGGAFTGHLTMHEINTIIDDNYVDFLVIGAGELALPKLLEYIEEKNNLLPENVVDIAKGVEISSLTKKAIPNLNVLPIPDFSQSNIEKYPCPLTILPLQTARGCTWRKCTFCSHHNGYFGEYHTFSIATVINTIAQLSQKYNCHHFVFHDDEIPANRLKAIGLALRKRNINVAISAYVRADNLFMQDHIFKELYNLGIKGLSWGIESGSQNVLNCIKKGINVEQVKFILKQSHLAGIVNTCWMMFNLPEESEYDFLKSIHFMAETAEYVDLWLVSPFRLQFDSPMYISGNFSRPKQLFSSSVEQTDSEKTREFIWTEKINSLYSMGVFQNNRFSQNLLPSGCQRARLIPFLYFSSLKDCNYLGEVQIILNDKTKIISFGTKTILIMDKIKVELTDEQFSRLSLTMNNHIPCNILNDSKMKYIKQLYEYGIISLLQHGPVKN